MPMHRPSKQKDCCDKTNASTHPMSMELPVARTTREERDNVIGQRKENRLHSSQRPGQQLSTPKKRCTPMGADRSSQAAQASKRICTIKPRGKLCARSLPC